MAIQKTPKMIIDELSKLEALTPEVLCDYLRQLAGYVQLALPPKRVAKSQIGSSAQAFIKEYCDAYELRYGTAPVITGKTAGTAKRIVKDIGLEKAIKLVQAFLKITNDPWICSKKHSIEVFEQNLNSINIFAETGKYLTFQEAQAREKILLKKSGTNF